MISVFTCALWVIPWFFISLTASPWRCQVCGGRRLERVPRSIVTWTLGGVAVLVVAMFGFWLLGGLISGSLRAPERPIPVKRG